MMADIRPSSGFYIDFRKMWSYEYLSLANPGGDCSYKNRDGEVWKPT